MAWWARLASLILLMGVVLSPPRAVAATVPMIIAYDAAVRPTPTMPVGVHDVRREAERPWISAYDDARIPYDAAANSPPVGGGEAEHAYDGARELADRRELRAKGVIYDAAPAATAAEGASTIDTSLVRFTQDTVSSRFSTGQTLNQTISELSGAGGDALAAKIQPIRIFESDGQLFTLDNRRLLAFSQAGREVPFTMVDATNPAIAREIAKKATTTAAQGWGQFITVLP